MKQAVPAGLFKPSAAETKNDAATKAAKRIVESEAAARNAKTERLRKARIEREQSLARASGQSEG